MLLTNFWTDDDGRITIFELFVIFQSFSLVSLRDQYLNMIKHLSIYCFPNHLNRVFLH